MFGGMSCCKLEILNATCCKPWAPIDLDIDHCREETLMQQMKRCIDRIESSQFYHDFKDQLQTPQVLEHLRMVLGSELEMKLVIYGIGKLQSHENSRLQLALAILMQRDFRWIGDIEVFDPVLSMTECRILEALGCSVLQFNEDAKRKAVKPTVFFMPHCCVMLYNNLLQANWKSDTLNNIVIFGNSFDGYASSQLLPYYQDIVPLVLMAAKFCSEFRVKTDFNDYYEDSSISGPGHRGAFNSLSLHFFQLNNKLQV